MKAVFQCNSKLEEASGFNIHFNWVIPPAGEGPRVNGNISFHNVDETIAAQFKPGKRYQLTLEEDKSAPGSK